MMPMFIFDQWRERTRLVGESEAPFDRAPHSQLKKPGEQRSRHWQIRPKLNLSAWICLVRMDWDWMYGSLGKGVGVGKAPP